MTLTTRVAAGQVSIDRRASGVGPAILQAELTLDQPIGRRKQPTIRFVYSAGPDNALGLYRLLVALGTPPTTRRKDTP